MARTVRKLGSLGCLGVLAVVAFVALAIWSSGKRQPQQAASPGPPPNVPADVGQAGDSKGQSGTVPASSPQADVSKVRPAPSPEQVAQLERIYRDLNRMHAKVKTTAARRFADPENKDEAKSWAALAREYGKALSEINQQIEAVPLRMDDAAQNETRRILEASLELDTMISIAASYRKQEFDKHSNWFRENMAAARKGLNALRSAGKPPEPTLRTWTDSTGKFERRAEFVTLNDGQVTLLKEDGTEINLPLDRLSEADKAFVSEITDDK